MLSLDLFRCSPTSRAWVPFAVVVALGAPDLVRAAVVPGRVVARQGVVPQGTLLPIRNLTRPFVNGLGQPAFVGVLEDGSDGDGFVFVGDAVVWTNSAAPGGTVLRGIEVVMGASDVGGFAYGTEVNSLDAIWTDQGALALEGDTLPGLPPAATTVFHSDARQLPDGTIYWRAGIDRDGVGGLDATALYRTVTGLPGDVELMVLTGELVSGETVDFVDNDYANAHNDAYWIQVYTLATGATNDDRAIALNQAIVVREGQVSNVGSAWGEFAMVAVNSGGHYLFTGNLAADDASNAFLGYDGDVVVREGDTVDGVVLSAASVRFIGLNDTGRVAYNWGVNGIEETTFYACDEGDIAGSSVRLIAVDDELDVDDDGVGDLRIADFNESTSLRGQALANDGTIYMEVDIDDGTGPVEAIVGVSVACCGNGNVDPGEACDDGNRINDDACTNVCSIPVCGDGIVQMAEACDDGNTDDGDGCSSTCMVESPDESSSSSSDETGLATATGGTLSASDSGSEATATGGTLDSDSNGSASETATTGRPSTGSETGSGAPENDDDGCGCRTHARGRSAWGLIIFAACATRIRKGRRARRPGGARL